MFIILNFKRVKIFYIYLLSYNHMYYSFCNTFFLATNNIKLVVLFFNYMLVQIIMSLLTRLKYKFFQFELD